MILDKLVVILVHRYVSVTFFKIKILLLLLLQ